MTDHLGTLAGLIADLEKLHEPYKILNETQCSECSGGTDLGVLWPCPTIELTRKHKRAMYRIERWGMDPTGIDPDDIAVMVDGGWVYRAKTREEAEAWIEKQVNGDE